MPEMEQELARLAGHAVGLSFTPHLIPMNRGELITIYLRPTFGAGLADIREALTRRYQDEPFVSVSDQPPATKATLGGNAAHLTVRADPRTGTVIAIGAIDNLVKGASGQAVQNANLLLGLPETLGLTTVGVVP